MACEADMERWRGDRASSAMAGSPAHGGFVANRNTSSLRAIRIQRHSHRRFPSRVDPGRSAERLPFEGPPHLEARGNGTSFPQTIAAGEAAKDYTGGRSHECARFNQTEYLDTMRLGVHRIGREAALARVANGHMHPPMFRLRNHRSHRSFGSFARCLWVTADARGMV